MMHHNFNVICFGKTKICIDIDINIFFYKTNIKRIISPKHNMYYFSGSTVIVENENGHGGGVTSTTPSSI